MYYSYTFLCCSKCTSAHTPVQKANRPTLPLAYACVTQYLQHAHTRQASTNWVSWTRPALQQNNPFLPLSLFFFFCAVMEFKQFTSMTFGKTKGRLEVTVSSWVSGRPLERGGGNHTGWGLVGCCVSQKDYYGNGHTRTYTMREGRRYNKHYLSF